MKIVDLLELLEFNQIENRLDKLISKKIIDAKNHWNIPINSLSQFILLLESETKNSTSKKDLENLLQKNKKTISHPNSDGIRYLLQIFNYTGFSNLKLVFTNLSKRLMLIERIIQTNHFEKKGYPTIHLFEKYFEIKSIDYYAFKKFKYSELKELKLLNPMDKWLYKFYIYSSWEGMMFADTDKIKLRIFKKAQGNWDYLTSAIENKEFNSIIIEINNRVKNVKI